MAGSLLLLIMNLHIILLCQESIVMAHLPARRNTSMIATLEEARQQCSSWTLYNASTQSCVCGKPLHNIVICHICNGYTSVQLKKCYCMSDYNNSESVVISECLFSCYTYGNSWTFYRELNITSTGNDAVCDAYQRQGPMCGNCKKNHAPPVYHYDYRLNWLKYIAVAYLP